jgi:hypothetical protein
MRKPRVFLAAAAAVAAAGAAVGALAPSAPKANAQTGGKHVIVFNGENNRLNAYDVTDGNKKQTVIKSADDDPANGRDINAQICFFPDGSRRFVAGEDTAQGSDAGKPGWGIFQLQGNAIGAFSAPQVGKLLTSFQTSDNGDERQPYESNPENYGCGFLSDGRIVTSDVGNQYPGTPSNGPLIVWFPDPAKGLDTYESRDVAHCKVDVEIPTAGGVYVDKQDRVYVASNRPSAPIPDRLPGIYRYSNLPKSVSDCTAVDTTALPPGAPKAATVNRELFIPGIPVTPTPTWPVPFDTPSAIVPSPNGGFYVSAVFTGTIREYDANGKQVGDPIMTPGAPGLPPYDNGTPYGLGIDSAGTLYYADLGVTVGPPPGPGEDLGTVRKIRFVDGKPQKPEIIDKGELQFPDGIGVLEIDAAPTTVAGQSFQTAGGTASAAPTAAAGPAALPGGVLPETGLAGSWPLAALGALGLVAGRRTLRRSSRRP